MKLSIQTFFPLYLFSIALICIGYISVLPPFEGFDETAHLSSILEVSSGKIPVYGISSIDKRIAEFGGAFSYRSGAPPFDSGGYGYKNFFDSPGQISFYSEKYIPGSSIVGYVPTGVDLALNWEAQHPPLFYILMSWVPNYSKNLNFLEYIFFLRLVSVSFFLIAVFVVVKSIQQGLYSADICSMQLGLLFYPMLIPMIFFDIARIGNDSLCLLICSMVAFLIPKLLIAWNKIIAFFIGALLGLGLLTKALFMPIGFAILVFIVILKSFKSEIKSKLISVFIIFITMTIISSWWYVRNYYQFGSFTGADEFIALNLRGGLFSNLAAKFSFYELLRGFIVPIVSYIWAGSGSLVRMPYFLTIPLVFINGIIFFSYVQYLIKNNYIFKGDGLFLWIFCIFYLSLTIHMVHVLALYGRGTTPGWYLNILFPWAVPAVGFGISTLLRRYRNSWVICNAIFVFLGIFQICSIYFLVTLYSGCSTKGASKVFEFQNQFYCLDKLGQMYDRMNLLGFPLLGLVSFLLGFSILFFLYFKSIGAINDAHGSRPLL